MTRQAALNGLPNGENGAEADLDGPDPPPVDARAREPLPQPHGGSIRPFLAGVPRDPSFVAKAQGMRAIRKECRRLMAEASEDNTRQFLKLCKDEDSRVSIVAIKEYFDRFYGKVGDTGLIHDETSEAPDVSGLDATQRREVNDAILVLARAMGREDGR